MYFRVGPVKEDMRKKKSYDDPLERLVYRVKPLGDGWVLTSQDSDFAIFTHIERREAVSVGCALAFEKRPASIILHKPDGTEGQRIDY